MKSQQIRQLLGRMAEAWARGDAHEAASCFSEDVDYADPTRYHFRGRAELVEFFEPPKDRDQQVTWHNVVFSESQQLGVAEYSYRGHKAYHGVVLAWVRDGVVERWREYQHVSNVPWEDFVEGAAEP
jgi:uncharacterized protein (TIGR02246 family)